MLLDLKKRRKAIHATTRKARRQSMHGLNDKPLKTPVYRWIYSLEVSMMLQQAWV
jgi:hypothetical protein